MLGGIYASAQGELAPIVDREFDYNNWTYSDIRTGRQIDLREFARGKKLVMVLYFAAWCPNWKNEAPVAQRLYEKYKGHGFGVVGVSEYDSISNTKHSLESFKITFPVVMESEGRDAFKMTLHYQYRTAAGDKRKWGSPWNIFLLPQNIQARGDVLVRKAPVVNGELIEVETERFIREKLGLPSAEKITTAAAKPIEACEPEKQASLKTSPF
jgi:peroxiredoxin